MSFKKLIQKIREIRNARKHKYISNFSALMNWIKNRKNQYKILSFKESIKEYKKSDTIFILGSGPSLNKIGEKHIEIINSKDSLGINFSFLSEKITPTYHQFSWERDYSLEYMLEAFNKYRKKFSETVIFLSDKAIYRFAHPRLTPQFFPSRPKCCYFNLPKGIHLNDGDDFSDDLFDETLMYRGTLSLQLDTLVKMGYKEIVLIGVDLGTTKHFFDEIPIMKGYVDIYYREKDRDNQKFESMYTKEGKAVSFDYYLEKLASYLERKRGVKLYTAYSDDYMASKLPSYFGERVES